MSKRTQPLMERQPQQPQDFWSRVRVGEPDECWPWTGGTYGRDIKYGRLKRRGRTEPAHRVAWILTNGALPSLPGADFRGTCVLHRCDFGLCCNPKHLFVGTNSDNIRDMIAKGRDRKRSVQLHCKRGHPRTPDNLYMNSKGYGACRTCALERVRNMRRAAQSKTQERFVC